MPDVETEAGGPRPPDIPPDIPPDNPPDVPSDIPPNQSTQVPAGPPLYIWFGGILEGKRRNAEDDATLRRIVASINQIGLGRAELEIDGGHFSLLMGEETLPGDQVRPEQREAFVRGLQEILDAVGSSGAVESTLRCTEVFVDRTAESLFAPTGGEIRSVGRLRDVNDADRAHAPVTTSAIGGGLSRLGKRNALLTLALVLVGGVLLAWNRGLVDQVFAVEGEKLTVDLASADQVLATELTSSWGNYVLTIRRGARYPTTTDARTALLGEVESTAELALLRAVVDGDEVFLRLEDEDDRVLSARSIKLRPLLTDPSTVVVVKIPGRMRAHHLRLALDSGTRRGGR